MGEPKKFVLFDNNYRLFRENIEKNVKIGNEFMDSANKVFDEIYENLNSINSRLKRIETKLGIN